ELVSRLEADGWVQVGRGDDWYEAEFARTTLVPARRAAETAEETAEAVPDHYRPMPAARTIPPASPLPPPPFTERRRLDRWRVAAAAGLAAAIGLLGRFATHDSSLRAASSAPRPASCALPTAPTRMPRPSRRTLSHGPVPGLR